MRENPKNDDLFVFRHIEDYLGHIRRGPFTKHFAQRTEVSGFDQAPDFGF